ncbi:class I SAM-dependent methyltransferase [Amycolatopsis eburnea]|uniref:Methyltransferase domain-containing protein n=1 Tax=Amycolatopsis eburnea TaxID=2267691 RepID=A0A3R9E5Q1_9PSEU|nr:class I SAM-dependent methyltransferase [Amycolatopsis eburnea]RSD20896.1 methyltransferase domain-containing protein [Amycolatopsis eburnea]
MTKAQRWRRYWDRKSATYDAEMDFWDRRLFGDSRDWACGQAGGDVLEVAVGTGLNLPRYPAGVTLTGLDLSEGMLEVARTREPARPVTLRQGDAQALPFEDASFDTVVCTFGLCAIPDPATAVAEMARVLRPGGRLILADHVVSTSWPVRVAQWLLELASVPLAGEHFRRRPLRLVEAVGLAVERRERFKLGLVERLVARKGG